MYYLVSLTANTIIYEVNKDFIVIAVPFEILERHDLYQHAP